MMKIRFTLILLFLVSNMLFSQRYIYWTDDINNAIERKHIKNGERSVLIPFMNTPTGLVVDYENGVLYFSDVSQSALVVADLNGQNVQNLAYFTNPDDLFLDKDSSLLYVSDIVDETIYTIKTDGSNKKALITGISKPRHFDVDLYNQLIFIRNKDINSSNIFKAKLDGSDLELLISQGYQVSGVAIDPIEKTLFWLSRDDEKYIGYLFKSDLNGEGIEKICDTEYYSFCLEFDGINGFLYWGEKIDEQRIMRVRTDGTDKIVFEKNVPSIGGIGLDINRISQTHETVYDTISVTDTLFIDITFSSINDLDLIHTIRVYPNPSNDILHIESGVNYQQLSGYKIEFTSLQGEFIFEQFIDSDLMVIDLESLFKTTGTYILTVMDPSGIPITNKKIVLY